MIEDKKPTDVYLDGEYQYTLNEDLIKRQKISSETIQLLVEKHVEKLKIFQLMKDTDDVVELKKLAENVTEIEFCLQKLWKFKEDLNYHYWFEVPKCTCPKIDNFERLGTKFKVINKKL
jgi:hypothetical protein